MYQEITAIIEYNRNHRGYGKSSVRQGYTLSGLLYCEKCGYALQLVNSRRKTEGEYGNKAYYHCDNSTCSIEGKLYALKTEQKLIDILISKSEQLTDVLFDTDEALQTPKMIELESQIKSLNAIPGNNPATTEAIKSLEFQLANLRKKYQIDNADNLEKMKLLKGLQDINACLS